MIINISCGDSSKWQGEADALFTNPYAPIPSCLHGKPSIISLAHRDSQDRIQRIRRTEGWLGGAQLEFLSEWGRNGHNSMFVANLPRIEVDLTDCMESHLPLVEGVGWFPLEMVERMLQLYRPYILPGMTIWDGFCGRGTVGKACEILGYNFIGLDIDPERVVMAKDYLGIEE